MKALAAAFAILIGCSSPKPTASPAPEPAPATLETIRASEAAANERAAQHSPCANRVTVYEGSIDVDASTYTQPNERGDGEEPIPDLDRVIPAAARIDFTLDYPFEKPFATSITGELTRRRVIDAVRDGLRHMYAGTTQRDIPNVANKDVTGPYGRAFHVISDLAIESVYLCDGRSLEISLGS